MQSPNSAMWIEERCEKYITKKFPPDQKYSTSGVIDAAFDENIRNCLKTLNFFLRCFDTTYVHKKKFCIFEIPSIGLKDVFIIPSQSELDREVCSYMWYA